jgi:hypothetical protein
MVTQLGRIQLKLGRRKGTMAVLVDGQPCPHKQRNKFIREWAYTIVLKDALAKARVESCSL